MNLVKFTTDYVTAADVADALKVGRATAYKYLREAAGRTTGRGALRCPTRTWERYVREKWPGFDAVRMETTKPCTTIEQDRGVSEALAPATHGPRKLSLIATRQTPKIPIPQPGTKPRSVTR